MIERTLYQHLQNCTELAPFLAEHSGKMAIFNQEAPPDMDKGWDHGSQYGRIVFAVDMTDDPDRKISGVLQVDFMCESDKQDPNEVEPIIRPLMDGYFFKSTEGTIAAQWRASNYFTTTTEKIIGVTLTYDLLAFPNQTTIEPDPIALLNKWTSTSLEGVVVIGHDYLPDVWKPAEKSVAIYWKLGQILPCSWINDTYNCSWQTAVISGHIMAPDENTAVLIARWIKSTLTVKKRLIFDDNAPLMVDRNIRVNATLDMLRTGQITLEATYGILTPPPPYNPLWHLSVNGREV